MSAKPFLFWNQYWGELLCDQESPGPSIISGFENISANNREKRNHTFVRPGTLWGFVGKGALSVRASDSEWQLKAGQWFCVASEGAVFDLAPDTFVFTINKPDYMGLTSAGGPVENAGRLKYIDGCTDTLLCPPPLAGDPCLNLLHFPSSTAQTFHFHPSARGGVVSKGRGTCEAENENIPLLTGTIFYVPPGLRHRFKTTAETLTVVSYHPDSDWGPTHELHPMINRTWMKAPSGHAS